MEIKKIAVGEINVARYNPRTDLKPGDQEYEKLKQSIQNFGYIEPLVWNKRTKTLVAGHQRLKILLENGITEVDVSVVDLPLHKEKTLNIALNKIEGTWDEEKLVTLLHELSEVPNFDVELTGFDLPEISELSDSQSENEEDNFDFDAAVNSIKEPITQKGDLIELGNHRILCGDSTNLDDLQKLMQDSKASLLDCDFPYNVNYMGGDHPKTNTRPKKSRKWERIYPDNMRQEEYESWMRNAFTNIKNFLHLGSAIYVWQGHRQFPPMYQILLDLGFHVSCVISWIKESAAISYADYSFQSEQCLYGWLKGASHYFAGQPGESNVWQIKRDPTKSYIHPTQKPIALRQRAVKNSSKKGDIVLDAFLGSGSLLLACESLGRRCFGVEIDPKYCDAAIQRYIAFVGEDNVSKNIKKRYLRGRENEDIKS